MTLKHPSPESLAALSEGRLAGEEKMSIVDHLSRCRDCYTLFAEAAAFVERGAQRSNALPARRRSARWVALAAAAAISIVIAGALLITNQHPPLHAVSVAAATNHPVRFRVSGGVAPGDTALRAGTQPANEDLLRVYLDLKKQKESDPSPRTLDAFGVSALLLGHADEAVDALRSAAAADQNANTESDLAAALAYRWESRASAKDLDDADAATRRALAIAPKHAEALFNRARLLEAEGDRPAAIAAWKRYLDLDATSAWARIARERLQRLSAPTSSEQWPVEKKRLIAGTANVRETVDRFPQESRVFVEEELLATLSAAPGDSPGKAGPNGEPSTFQLARSISEELARRGDPLPLMTVQRLESPSEAERKAMRLYAEGRRAMKLGSHADADKLLRSAVEEMDRDHFPFEPRARIALISNDFYQSEYARALDESRSALQVDLRKFPAAEAHLRWLEGLTLLSQGRLIEGLEAYRRSEHLYEHLGEAESLAGVRDLIAEALEYAGDLQGAERERQIAVAGLLELGDADRAPAILSEAADSALHRGNLDRALSLQRRIRAHAESRHDTVWVIHAALDASEILSLQGDYAGALREIRDAEQRLRTIDDPATRTRLSADVQIASLRARPEATDLSAYDAVVSLLQEQDNHYYTAKLLLEKGERQQRRGDFRGAEKTMRSGLEELERIRGRVDDIIARSRYFETGTKIVDALVVVLIDQRRATDALLALQRANGRTVLESASERTAVGALSVADLLDAIPRQSIAIEYKLIGERLLTWAIRDSRIEFRESRIDREGLRRNAAALQEAASHDRTDDFDRAAAALYSALIEPLAPILGNAHSCIIVADAELSDVPFEALRADKSNPYLIERMAIAYAPSLAVLKFRISRPAAPITTAALFGSPNVDQAKFPDLPPLSASADEVRDAAALYPNSRTFLGSEATRDALMRSMRQADVVHVAAHSVENGDAPFLSMLLLSASGSDSGIVYAHDIAAARVGARIVVLAGCGTAAGARLGTEGMTSLATAFLAGGAEAVVGTCWPIRDDSAAAIMTAFHRAIRSGLAPDAALRQARIEALHAQPGRLGWVPYQLLVASKMAIEGRS